MFGKLKKMKKKLGPGKVAGKVAGRLMGGSKKSPAAGASARARGRVKPPTSMR